MIARQLCVSAMIVGLLLARCRDAASQADPTLAQQRWHWIRSHTVGVLGQDQDPRDSDLSTRDDSSAGGIHVPPATDGIHEWYTNRHKQVLCGQLQRLETNCLLSGRFAGECDLNNFIVPRDEYRVLSEFYECDTSTSSARRDPSTPCHAWTDAIETEITPPSDLRRYLQERLGWRSGFRWWDKFLLNDTLCVYGPWVLDTGHANHPEIHPAQQIWWSGPGGSFYVFLMQDASARYSRVLNFLLDKPPKAEWGWKPWAASPIRGRFTFALAWDSSSRMGAKLVDLQAPGVPSGAELPRCGDGKATVPVTVGMSEEKRKRFSLCAGEWIQWEEAGEIHALLSIDAEVGRLAEFEETGLAMRLEVPDGLPPLKEEELHNRGAVPKLDTLYQPESPRLRVGLRWMAKPKEWKKATATRSLPAAPEGPAATLWRLMLEKARAPESCWSLDPPGQTVYVLRRVPLRMEVHAEALPFTEDADAGIDAGSVTTGLWRVQLPSGGTLECQKDQPRRQLEGASLECDRGVGARIAFADDIDSPMQPLIVSFNAKARFRGQDLEQPYRAQLWRHALQTPANDVPPSLLQLVAGILSTGCGEASVASDRDLNRILGKSQAGRRSDSYDSQTGPSSRWALVDVAGRLIEDGLLTFDELELLVRVTTQVKSVESPATP